MAIRKIELLLLIYDLIIIPNKFRKLYTKICTIMMFIYFVIKTYTVFIEITEIRNLNSDM